MDAAAEEAHGATGPDRHGPMGTRLRRVPGAWKVAPIGRQASTSGKRQREVGKAAKARAKANRKRRPQLKSEDGGTHPTLGPGSRPR